MMRLFKRRWIRNGVIGCIAMALLLTAVVVLFRKPVLSGIPFGRAVYDRNGKLLRLSLASDDKFRVFTPLDDISPALAEATLLYEDRHFQSHPGVNPISVIKA